MGHETMHNGATIQDILNESAELQHWFQTLHRELRCSVIAVNKQHAQCGSLISIINENTPITRCRSSHFLIIVQIRMCGEISVVVTKQILVQLAQLLDVSLDLIITEYLYLTDMPSRLRHQVLQIVNRKDTI